MKRQKQTEEEVRAEIVSTAQALFKRYGFAKTTMEDIAKSIKKGKSTLYYYYSCKDDIINDVIVKETDEIYRTVAASIVHNKTASDKLRTFFDVILKEIKTKANLYGTIKSEIIENHTRTEAATKFEKLLRTLLSEILEQGIESKEFTYISLDDVEKVAATIMMSLGGFMLNINKLDSDSMLYASSELMANILIKGLK